MQRGHILKHHGAWFLRYWSTELRNGVPVRVRKGKRLAPINTDYPNERSVLPLAEDILTPINRGTQTPDSAMLVSEFIEAKYLPYVKQNLRPSTYKDYKRDIYEKHVAQRLGKLRLRDFRTVNGQRILTSIHENNSNVGHKTLLRIKSFLSGAFKHAKREGVLDGLNPMVDVSAPGRLKKFKAPIYSLSETMDLILAITSVEKKGVEGVNQSTLNLATTAIVVAAFTGLRISEIRGLRWDDWTGDTLTVSRSVWRTHVNAPKTEGSEGTIPVLPLLQEELTRFRGTEEGKRGGSHGYIFAGERRGAPLNLANLTRRTILKAIENYNSQRPESKPEIQWRGWHAFRRGLASNLYSLGVTPKVIAAILRHSDIATTLEWYVKTPDAEMKEAMERVGKLFPFGL